MAGNICVAKMHNSALRWNMLVQCPKVVQFFFHILVLPRGLEN